MIVYLDAILYPSISCGIIRLPKRVDIALPIRIRFRNFDSLSTPLVGHSLPNSATASAGKQSKLFLCSDLHSPCKKCVNIVGFFVFDVVHIWVFHSMSG